VVTHRPEIHDCANAHRVNVLIPQNRRVTCETALSTSYRWTERNVILLGDVIYANRVMQRMVQCKEPVLFFGDLWEMFGVAFSAQDVVRRALQWGADCPHGKIRHAYRRMIDAPCKSRESIESLKRSPNFVYINDWVTRDCDTPGEYQRILSELVNKRILEKE
jgi:hypothetical protein